MAKRNAKTVPGQEYDYATPMGDNATFNLVFSHTAEALPGQKFERPNWNYWTFEYITEGSGTLEIGGKTYTPEAGDLYLLPRGMGHCYYADMDEPWKKIYFVVTGSLVFLLLSEYKLSDTYFIPECGCEEIFKKMLYIQSEPEKNKEGAACLLFHELLIRLSHIRHNEDTPWSTATARVIEFIKNSLEKPVRMEDIAEAAGITRSHLTRLFKKETGITPYEYLTRQRIEMAKKLLLCTPLTITEIADRLQYADAYYFSNTFKKHTGMSPTKFREDAS